MAPGSDGCSASDLSRLPSFVYSYVERQGVSPRGARFYGGDANAVASSVYKRRGARTTCWGADDWSPLALRRSSQDHLRRHLAATAAAACLSSSAVARGRRSYSAEVFVCRSPVGQWSTYASAIGTTTVPLSSRSAALKCASTTPRQVADYGSPFKPTALEFSSISLSPGMLSPPGEVAEIDRSAPSWPFRDTRQRWEYLAAEPAEPAEHQDSLADPPEHVRPRPVAEALPLPSGSLPIVESVAEVTSAKALPAAASRRKAAVMHACGAEDEAMVAPCPVAFVGSGICELRRARSAPGSARGSRPMLEGHSEDGIAVIGAAHSAEHASLAPAHQEPAVFSSPSQRLAFELAPERDASRSPRSRASDAERASCPPNDEATVAGAEGADEDRALFSSASQTPAFQLSPQRATSASPRSLPSDAKWLPILGNEDRGSFASPSRSLAFQLSSPLGTSASPRSSLGEAKWGPCLELQDTSFEGGVGSDAAAAISAQSTPNAHAEGTTQWKRRSPVWSSEEATPQRETSLSRSKSPSAQVSADAPSRGRWMWPFPEDSEGAVDAPMDSSIAAQQLVQVTAARQRFLEDVDRESHRQAEREFAPLVKQAEQLVRAHRASASTVQAFEIGTPRPEHASGGASARVRSISLSSEESSTREKRRASRRQRHELVPDALVAKVSASRESSHDPLNSSGTSSWGGLPLPESVTGASPAELFPSLCRVSPPHSPPSFEATPSSPRPLPPRASPLPLQPSPRLSAPPCSMGEFYQLMQATVTERAPVDTGSVVEAEPPANTHVSSAPFWPPSFGVDAIATLKHVAPSASDETRSADEVDDTLPAVVTLAVADKKEADDAGADGALSAEEAAPSVEDEMAGQVAVARAVAVEAAAMGAVLSRASEAQRQLEAFEESLRRQRRFVSFVATAFEASKLAYAVRSLRQATRKTWQEVDEMEQFPLELAQVHSDGCQQLANSRRSVEDLRKVVKEQQKKCRSGALSLEASRRSAAEAEALYDGAANELKETCARAMAQRLVFGALLVALERVPPDAKLFSDVLPLPLSASAGPAVDVGSSSVSSIDSLAPNAGEEAVDVESKLSNPAAQDDHVVSTRQKGQHSADEDEEFIPAPSMFTNEPHYAAGFTSEGDKIRRRPSSKGMVSDVELTRLRQWLQNSTLHDDVATPPQASHPSSIPRSRSDMGSSCSSGLAPLICRELMTLLAMVLAESPGLLAATAPEELREEVERLRLLRSKYETMVDPLDPAERTRVLREGVAVQAVDPMKFAAFLGKSEAAEMREAFFAQWVRGWLGPYLEARREVFGPAPQVQRRSFLAREPQQKYWRQCGRVLVDGMRNVFGKAIVLVGVEQEALIRLLMDFSQALCSESEMRARFAQVLLPEAERPKEANSLEDAVFLLAYHALMLNTALHNPNVRGKMPKDKFVQEGSHIAGVQPDFCKKMYDLIKATPFGF